MMNKTRRTRLRVYLFVLATTSCGFPRLSELTDGGVAGDGGDGASEDAGQSPFGLELLAGDIGGPGNADGAGAAARFGSPGGVAIDSAGNAYVADGTIIRKVTATGVVTALAGSAGAGGSVDGTGAAARFSDATGVAVDIVGNVYVADLHNFTIRKVTPAGVVTTLAGFAGVRGSADGTGAAARFEGPTGVAVDSAGNVYVADTDNQTIRKITAGGVVTTLAGATGLIGSTDGTGSAARFTGPSGVAVDDGANVYVADKFNSTIRKVTAGGVVTTLAGTAGMVGSADGTGTAARFDHPSAVAVDSARNVYVADQSNHTIRKVTAGGAVTTLAGTAGMAGSADAMGAAARFNDPTGVTVDSAGNVYIADTDNSSIRKITPSGGVTTLAGAAAVAGSADGTGAAGRFSGPVGVAVGGDGNVYVADEGNATIRKVTAGGTVTTLAGTAGMRGSTDDTGTAARFNFPTGVAVDSAGNVYVADGSDMNSNAIRKVTAGGVATTLAGTAGSSGSLDGTGAAARFHNPAGAAVDGAGNVYVADLGNSTIRKITTAGLVTTLAGSAGSSGSADGTGAAARFSNPFAAAVDSAGNVYVADRDNFTIRKITAAGVVTTLAGSAGIAGNADGTGPVARFGRPTGVAVDSAGNVYVADQGNATIRKVMPTGTTTTIAGTAGVVGVVLGTTPRFASPRSLAIVGDSIVLSDANAILLLRHGTR